jgi:DNA polymerase-4
MWQLSVKELYGVGKQTALKFEGLGIKTIKDLAEYDLDKLSSLLKKQGKNLWEFANGIDESDVISEKDDNKCISNSVTLEKNIINSKDAYPIIMSLCENVGTSLRKQNKYANVVAIIIKDKYFHSYTRQKHLDNSTNITNEIYKHIIKLFDKYWDGEGIRLIGVYLGNLTSKNQHQISLFEETRNLESDEKLEKVIDKLKIKYGGNIIRPAITNKNKIEKHH